jgi:dolichyl-phosphate-mannose-protein mannosyltransferase
MEGMPIGMRFQGAAARLSELAPGMLFLLAMALFAPRLAVPAQYEFDEVYHAYTAGQYVAGNADAYLWYTIAPKAGVAYMWNHPPAGVLCIAGGILIWGDNPFGWRFAAALFGAAGVVLTFTMASRLTRDRRLAALAAVLVLSDGMYFSQSRVAMLDIFGAVFALGALLSLYGFLTSEPERIAWPLVRTGLWLGLALATKWNGAYVSFFCGLAIVVRAVRLGLRSPELRRPLVVWTTVGLVLAPLAVYFAAYIPFFAAGHDFGEWVEVQKQTFYYHTRLEATHPWSSSWWQWPLALRPVWYWTAAVAGGDAANGYAAPNPVLYWSFLPAVVWLAARWRRNSAALTVLIIGFFGQWLPWALVPRIAFAYHFLPAVPFGAMATAAAVMNLHRRGGGWRWLGWGFVATVAATFVFYYPILVGLPLSPRALAWRLWLPGWRPT